MIDSRACANYLAELFPNLPGLQNSCRNGRYAAASRLRASQPHTISRNGGTRRGNWSVYSAARRLPGSSDTAIR